MPIASLMLLLLNAPLPSASAAAGVAPPSYSRQVQPFFTRYCVECHNAKDPESNLSLENFKQLIMKDKQVTSRVPHKQIERAFDLKRQLKNVDKIFERVFGKTKKS